MRGPGVVVAQMLPQFACEWSGVWGHQGTCHVVSVVCFAGTVAEGGFGQRYCGGGADAAAI